MKQHLVERMLYVVLGLVFVCALVASVVAVRAAEEFTRQQEILQEQVAGQKEVLKGMQELIKNQGKTTDDINNSISCVMAFYARPDWASFYISNLETCILTDTSTGKTQILPLIPMTNSPTPPSANQDVGVSIPGNSQATPPKPNESVSPPSPELSPSKDTLNILIDIPTNIVRSII